MAKQTINIGSSGNDGTGTPLRDGGDLINDNFNEIYTALGDGTNLTSGTFVTETGTHTLTNKSVDLTDNTITGTLAEFNTAVSDATLVSTSDSQTLTNKSIDVDNNTVSNIEVDNLKSGVLDTDLSSVSASDDTLASAKAIKSYIDTNVSSVSPSSTTTFTNKTFDANGTGNSISNIEVADLASGVLDTDLNSVAGTDTTLASAKAIKTYVDTIAAAGIHYHDPVRVESPSNLNASYDNGTSGVGATLTNTGTLAAITIDGVALNLNDRVLIDTQTNAAHNGVYFVSTVGDGATAWVLTRTTDTDSYGASDSNALGEGDAFFVREGDTGAGELNVMNTSGTITFGTTNITFSVIAETAVYSAGTGLNLTGTTFSVDSGGITSTQLNSAVNLQILDSSGSVVKTLYGSGS